MTEFLHERNVGPHGRIHYAVVYGGEAPNVTPDLAHVWYYAREISPARVQVLFNKITDCARAAAIATQTEMVPRIHASVWNELGNRVGAELLHENMVKIGPPQHSATDRALARGLQATLGVPQMGLSAGIEPLRPPATGGYFSTDTADVSWQTPTLSCLATTRPLGTPNHHWSVTATAATHMAHAGMIKAAHYLATTAIDLFEQPEVLNELREEFRQRKSGVQWRTQLPDDAQPPVYEPPRWFLDKTGQSWSPRVRAWPPERFVSHLQSGSLGPSEPTPGYESA